MEGDYSTEEYEEIEKRIPFQVAELRVKLKEKHNLVIPENCDEFLARCLRMKDGNLDKAVTLTKAYHNATAGFQKWDATFQPSLYVHFFKSGAMTPMLQRDSKGRHIIVMRTGLWDPEKMNFDEGMGCVWMLHQYMTLRTKEAQRQGLVTVLDFAEFSMQHVLAINKWRLPYIVKIIQNGVCGRIKGFHVINHPRVISVIYSGLKPFLKEKLKRRVHFHDDPNNLFDHLDKKSLPIAVGGTLNLAECTDTALMKEFLAQDSYFIDTMDNRFPPK